MSDTEYERIVMGIDPGTQVTGYGILREHAGKLNLLGVGVIRAAEKGDSHPKRLSRILRGINKLLDLHIPDEVAIEAPFYGTNVQSMLKLGRVQGVVMAAAMQRDIPVAEYAPSKVKKAIAGNGKAAKEQLAAVLAQILPELKLHRDLPLDATDALAVALCHYYQGNVPGTSGGGGGGNNKRYGSWDSFIEQNPDRLK